MSSASSPPPAGATPSAPEPRTPASPAPSVEPSRKTLRGDARRPLHARLIWTIAMIAGWLLIASLARAVLEAWAPKHHLRVVDFWSGKAGLGSGAWFMILGLAMPGAFIGVLTFLDSAERGSMNRRLARLQGLLHESTGILAGLGPYMVRPILFVTHASMLCVAYAELDVWRRDDPLARLGVIALCLVPSVLTMCVASLTERRMTRVDVALTTPERTPGVTDDVWRARCTQAEHMWRYENELMRESVQRLARHGAMFGFIASGILLVCAVVALRYLGLKDARALDRVVHYLIPMATGTAVLVSFSVHLGQVLFRSASNDATARMMAWAARTLLLVGLATVFLAATLVTSGSADGAASMSGAILQEQKGALLVGIVAGLLGERVLQAVTERAAKIVGVSDLKPAVIVDLTAIEGLSEEDIARLAEERIDSLHALAFVPTPRLFFNTTYSLQRICDWQDQALLIVHFGRTKALLLREQNVVRGAIAARRLAEQLASYRPSDSAASGQKGLGYDQLKEIALALGFQSIEHAARGLASLSEDEVVQRLEVFWRSLPAWTSDRPGETAADG